VLVDPHKMKQNLSRKFKELEFKAIGTTWYLEFFEELRPEIIKKMQNLIQDFEANYSRFMSTSFVSLLNSQKYFLAPNTEFLEMLKIAKQAKEITAGAFDITVGGILEEMGYNREYTYIPTLNKVYHLGKVEYSKDKISLSENAKVDLGGLGKGFLVDKVQNFLKQQGLSYFLINAGGDIYATSIRGSAIEFGLENPFNAAELIGTINIKDQAIASSSNNRRKWQYQNQEYHHIVNLEGKFTSAGVKAVYTLADSCLNADLASTAIFLTPPELHQKISKFYGVEYMIVFENHTFIKSQDYPAKLS
jgi:FAD:protein FMN transferase